MSKIEKDKIYVKSVIRGGSIIYSNHEFFQEKKEVVFEFYDDKLCIRIADIDDYKTHVTHQHGGASFNRCYTSLLNDRDGVYLIDEDETNIDQVVFYFEDCVLK